MLSTICVLLLISAQSGPAGGHIPIRPAVPLTHPWPMRFGDPARTGRSSSHGAQLGTLGWKFRIAGSAPQFAVAADGSIHCGAVYHEEWWSEETYIYVLTAGGTVEWRAKIAPYVWGFAQDVGGSPALDAMENVVNPGAAGKLHEFAPDGNLRWTYAGNSGSTQDSSPAVLADGTIRDFMGGHGLVALGDDGSLLWQNATLFTRNSSVAVAANGEMALSGVTSNEPHNFRAIHYLNADGSLRWTRTTLTGEDSTPVIGDDGIVYARLNGTVAFRPDNTIVWSNPTAATSRALGRNGVLYLGAGTTIRLVDAVTGVQSSFIQLPGSANEGLAIDASGNVYATTSNGYACGYTAAGVPIFEARLADSFSTGPVIATGSRLVAAGREGFTKYVYSIR